MSRQNVLSHWALAKRDAITDDTKRRISRCISSVFVVFRHICIRRISSHLRITINAGREGQQKRMEIKGTWKDKKKKQSYGTESMNSEGNNGIR